MFTLPPVHLAVMQPAGDLRALGFVDAARQLRFQFRRFGADVSIAKNRLREDAVNIVFGAHLGFDPAWLARHACIFFNLEPLGGGRAAVSGDYLTLLRHSAVVDVDARNVPAYCSQVDDVPIVPFLHAPYLEPTADQYVPLEQRPIELLFFGRMSPRRQAVIDRIEAAGLPVTLFDGPLYGAERDALIRQARAVLACAYDDAGTLDPLRVAQSLSLGTPVLCERADASMAVGASLEWFDASAPERSLADWGTAAWFDRARTRLAQWRTHDPVETYADLLAFAAGFKQGHAQRADTAPWQPTEIAIGRGADYRPGRLHLDRDERADPDFVVDPADRLALPVAATTRHGAPLDLQPASIARIEAALDDAQALPALMDNALALLATGGELTVDLPVHAAPPDAHWFRYTEGFAQAGWFEHRFEFTGSAWLDADGTPCTPERARTLRMTLQRIETTLRERTVARALQSDFGGLDDDLPLDAKAAPADAPPTFMAPAAQPALAA